MLKYIIGAIAKVDAPLTPSMEGSQNFLYYLSGVTQDELQKIRDEILSTDVAAIRNLAPIVKAVTDADNICAMGDENKIEAAKDLFKELKTLA